jgi:hypothetical protein
MEKGDIPDVISYGSIIRSGHPLGCLIINVMEEFSWRNYFMSPEECTRHSLMVDHRRQLIETNKRCNLEVKSNILDRDYSIFCPVLSRWTPRYEIFHQWNILWIYHYISATQMDKIDKCSVINGANGTSNGMSVTSAWSVIKGWQKWKHMLLSFQNN